MVFVMVLGLGRVYEEKFFWKGFVNSFPEDGKFRVVRCSA